jgi:hypothetical protein
MIAVAEIMAQIFLLNRRAQEAATRR